MQSPIFIFSATLLLARMPAVTGPRGLPSRQHQLEVAQQAKHCRQMLQVYCKAVRQPTQLSGSSQRIHACSKSLAALLPGHCSEGWWVQALHAEALLGQPRKGLVRSLSQGMLSQPQGSSTTAADIIRLAGYPVEEHTVTTADGYILLMERIPRHGLPLAVHGLACCACFTARLGSSLAACSALGHTSRCLQCALQRSAST